MSTVPSHVNVITLIGMVSDDPMILVLPLCENGSLLLYLGVMSRISLPCPSLVPCTLYCVSAAPCTAAARNEATPSGWRGEDLVDGGCS